MNYSTAPSPLWKPLEKQALQLLLDADVTHSLLYLCVWSFPSFGPFISYTVTQLDRKSEKASVRRTIWNRSYDWREIHDPLACVKYQANLVPLVPTITIDETDILSSVLSGIIQTTQRITIPMYYHDQKIYLDGTQCGLRIGGTYTKVHYEWRKGAVGWKPVEQFLNDVFIILEKSFAETDLKGDGP
ncbi:MAG: hypothetical protein ACYDBB_14290 [Armatimonadota bacterium]